MNGEYVRIEMLYRELNNEWPLIFKGALIGLFLGLGSSFFISNYYKADILISPVKDGKSGVGGGILTQFGGLASLAGVNLAGGGSSEDAQATLASRALLGRFINERDLLPLLFRDKWDDEKKNWKSGWSYGDSKPTLWDATKLFLKSILRIDVDKKTGLIRLSIEWRDPKQAADWANGLVQLTNQMLRERALAESGRNLEYLNGQLTASSVVELRQSIYKLIEGEIKNTMLARGSDEYAFKVIDPAVVPERKAGPQRGLIAASGSIVGAVLALFFIFIRIWSSPTASKLQ
jgi:uncharacterized protein involved in exopolysaccharide biosynthesis